MKLNYIIYRMLAGPQADQLNYKTAVIYKNHQLKVVEIPSKRSENFVSNMHRVAALFKDRVPAEPKEVQAVLTLNGRIAACNIKVKSSRIYKFLHAIFGARFDSWIMLRPLSVPNPQQLSFNTAYRMTYNRFLSIVETLKNGNPWTDPEFVSRITDYILDVEKFMNLLYNTLEIKALEELKSIEKSLGKESLDILEHLKDDKAFWIELRKESIQFNVDKYKKFLMDRLGVTDEQLPAARKMLYILKSKDKILYLMGRRLEDQNNAYWLYRSAIQDSLNLIKVCYSNLYYKLTDNLTDSYQSQGALPLIQQWNDIFERIQTKFTVLVQGMSDQRYNPIINERLAPLRCDFRKDVFSLDKYIVNLERLINMIENEKAFHKIYGF